MNYAAVDFESYYDKECTITSLGTDGYLHHPLFDCYLVSIVTDTWEWCGHPSKAPWHDISGPDWEWLAWNASFDERVYQFLQERCLVPSDCNPHLWHCCADLSAYCAAPRSLAGSCKYLYKESVSKTVRDNLKGVIFATLAEAQQKEVTDYCLIDSRKTLRMWHDHSGRWPDKERRLSRLTREMGWYGVRTDMPRIERHISHLKGITWAAEQKIPWSDTAASLSYPALCAECKKVGIEAPVSMAMTNEACAIWEETYGDRFPWIDAMRTLRRANMLLKKLEVMRDRTGPNGRMSYAMKYAGTHTLRWSGGGGGDKQSKETGWNAQNLAQDEMFGEKWLKQEGKHFADLFQPGEPIEGVDLRRCIIPAEGCHFPICDLSQIEPRVLWAFAKDEESLEMVRKGMSPYEVHARLTMGYTNPLPMKKGDPAGYRLAKARVLALGYGAGWYKFITMARTYEAEACFDADITPANIAAFERYLGRVNIPEWSALWARADEVTRKTYVNSWLIVSDFRRSNPKIVALWRKLEEGLLETVSDPEDRNFYVALPSGRSVTYSNILQTKDGFTGTVIKFGKPMQVKLYGGLICENICQAAARDVFAEGLLRLDDAGHLVVMTCHDEAVPEVLLEVPAEEVEDIMSRSPDWWKRLPVASECASHLFYAK